VPEFLCYAHVSLLVVPLYATTTQTIKWYYGQYRGTVSDRRRDWPSSPSSIFWNWVPGGNSWEVMRPHHSYKRTELLWSQDSVIGMAVSYGLEVQVSIPGRGKGFTSPCRSHRLWGPSSLLSNYCRKFLSRQVKRPGYEASHPPQSRAEVKNCGATPPLHYTSISVVPFHYVLSTGDTFEDIAGFIS
jgi:hypothetical protein